MSAIEPTSSLRDLEDKLDRIIELLEEISSKTAPDELPDPKRND